MSHVIIYLDCHLHIMINSSCYCVTLSIICSQCPSHNCTCYKNREDTFNFFFCSYFLWWFNV